jgi:hypothetical protein
VTETPHPNPHPCVAPNSRDAPTSA